MTEMESFITKKKLNITTHKGFVIFTIDGSEVEYYAKWVTVEPMDGENRVIYETWRGINEPRQNV